jgi:UDP-N-acetyl-D-mannosaminuronic acid dehydrogenase
MNEKGIDEIFTIDIDENKNAGFLSVKEFNKHHKADVYIVCVWTQEQVLSIVRDIDLSNKPLISIETASEIGTYARVEDIIDNRANLIIFQERWNPNDEFHGIFNQPRIMGGDIDVGRKFYLRYMLWENIIIARDPYIAELTKIVENAYRFVEIAIAEELRLMVKHENDFEELRRLVNTKWNINLKEARDGIGGPCLPKDIKILNSYSLLDGIFEASEKIDKVYKKVI